MSCEWKKLKLYEEKNGREDCMGEKKQEDQWEEKVQENDTMKRKLEEGTGENRVGMPEGSSLGECLAELARDSGSSAYLLARDELEEERQKELLYRVLGPVFFGEKAAANRKELIELFRVRYGIDVEHDFYEGDEHYEEYMEAQQAIAEGLSIYGGTIVFEDCVLAEYAEQLWADMEKFGSARFRRINTMLEE